MATATLLHAQLKEAVTNGDEQGAKVLLGKLKIELSELGLLLPSLSSSPEVGALSAAREILEIGAFQSIRSQDVPAFERYLSLLTSYYSKDISTLLPPSANEAPLLALSLLRLLSQNRIAEFHTLLETLPEHIVLSNEFGWVTSLEQNLMEGSYSRVWSLCKPPSATLPRPEFAYFTASLISTVRNEIASCDEKAYTTLPLVDAKTLLFFDKDEEVREFAKSRGWHLDSQSVLHFKASPSYHSTGFGVPTSISTGLSTADKELDKEKVVAATLAYARELESIV